MRGERARRGGRARWSATLLALALALGSAWWSAATTMTVLHDDARFTTALTTALDTPQVRAEIGDWLDQILENTSTRSDAQLAQNPIVTRLRDGLAGDEPIAPLVDAAVHAAVTARDAAITQLDAPEPTTRAVYADLAPLLDAIGVKVTAATAKELGMKLRDGRLDLLVLTGEQLQDYQRHYDLLRLVSRYAGWAALLLLAAAVLTGRRPLLTLVVGGVLAVVAALALSPLLGQVGASVSRSEVGASLVAPLTVALDDATRPYRWPTVLVAGGVALACATIEVARVARRHRGDP